MSTEFIRWLNGLPYTTPESFEQAYREYLGPVEYPNREVDSDDASRAGTDEGKFEEGN